MVEAGMHDRDLPVDPALLPERVAGAGIVVRCERDRSKVTGCGAGETGDVDPTLAHRFGQHGEASRLVRQLDDECVHLLLLLSLVDRNRPSVQVAVIITAMERHP
jgi:hypothetical protein